MLFNLYSMTYIASFTLVSELTRKARVDKNIVQYCQTTTIIETWTC